MTLCLSGILLAGCSAPSVPASADFKNISTEGWAYGDTLRFDVPFDSIARSHQFAVAVRHSSSYKFANIWLEVAVETPDTVFVDTLNMRLADRYGRRTGRGTGVSYIKTDTLPRLYMLADSAKVSVRHIMRIDTLTDLEQIGVIAVK